jgi:hypothetical protein
MTDATLFTDDSPSVATLRDIHEAIRVCSERMEARANQLFAAAEAAAEAQAILNFRHSEERLRARAEGDGRRMTADEARDHANVTTEHERRTYLLARGRLVALLAMLKADQSQMDGLRTRAEGMLVPVTTYKLR